jgi:23S rRNA pseudouridine1911/1915/1917 synthase
MFPKTGRTHQLRVHMQHLGRPIVADHLYGGREELKLSEILPKDRNDEISESKRSEVLISRQALHAHKIEFEHPEGGQLLSFEAPLPEDIQRTLGALREFAGKRA